MTTMRERELPSLPTAALQLLKAVSASNVGVGELTRIIKADPALAGKLLQVANSADRAGSRRVVDLRRAVLLLGARKVAAVALNFSLTPDSMTQSRYREWYTKFWFRSLTIAIAAETVAGLIGGVTTNDGFVLGLLGNVGHLAALNRDPEFYVSAIENRDANVDRDCCPVTADGQTSHALTLAIAHKWCLPDDSIAAIHECHNCRLTGGTQVSNDVAQVLLAAAALGDFFDGTNRRHALHMIDLLLCERFGVSESEMERLVNMIRHRISEYDDLFDLDLSKMLTVNQMLDEAREFRETLDTNQPEGSHFAIDVEEAEDDLLDLYMEADLSFHSEQRPLTLFEHPMIEPVDCEPSWPKLPSHSN